MKLPTAQQLLLMGGMLVGLGFFGLVGYKLRQDSFRNAMKQFAENFPDKISALRAELLSEEGISDGG